MTQLTTPTTAGGPLVGVRVVELGGVGPVPFAGMLLADMGADVVRLERPAGTASGRVRPTDVYQRGKQVITADLKDPHTRAALLDLVGHADVVLEGFRPGVAERLGVGPDDVRVLHPRVVYGRMTGWGQTGQLAQYPGHDINYIAVSGALSLFHRPGEAPVPPLNLLGDFGGGSMFLVFGVLCALIERHTSGAGQIVDSAMVDGLALLLAGVRSAAQRQSTNFSAGEHHLAGAAPYYGVYATADGRYLSVGAIEPDFYANFLTGLGLDPDLAGERDDRTRWTEMRRAIAAAIETRTLAEWVTRFEGIDACVAPVLTLDEVPDHPHSTERGAFVASDQTPQPAPAPRLSRTPGSLRPPAAPIELTEVTQRWTTAHESRLIAQGAPT